VLDWLALLKARILQCYDLAQHIVTGMVVLGRRGGVKASSDGAVVTISKQRVRTIS